MRLVATLLVLLVLLAGCSPAPSIPDQWHGGWFVVSQAPAGSELKPLPVPSLFLVMHADHYTIEGDRIVPLVADFSVVDGALHTARFEQRNGTSIDVRTEDFNTLLASFTSTDGAVTRVVFNRVNPEGVQ